MSEEFSKDNRVSRGDVIKYIAAALLALPGAGGIAFSILKRFGEKESRPDEKEIVIKRPIPDLAYKREGSEDGSVLLAENLELYLQKIRDLISEVEILESYWRDKYYEWDSKKKRSEWNEPYQVEGYHNTISSYLDKLRISQRSLSSLQSKINGGTGGSGGSSLFSLLVDHKQDPHVTEYKDYRVPNLGEEYDRLHDQSQIMSAASILGIVVRVLRDVEGSPIADFLSKNFWLTPTYTRRQFLTLGISKKMLGEVDRPRISQEDIDEFCNVLITHLKASGAFVFFEYLAIMYKIYNENNKALNPEALKQISNDTKENFERLLLRSTTVSVDELMGEIGFVELGNLGARLVDARYIDIHTFIEKGFDILFNGQYLDFETIIGNIRNKQEELSVIHDEIAGNADIVDVLRDICATNDLSIVFYKDEERLLEPALTSRRMIMMVFFLQISSFLLPRRHEAWLEAIFNLD